MGLCVHVFYLPSLFWTGYCLGADSLLPAQPIFLSVFVGLLAGDPVVTLHCSCYIITSLLFLCYLWAFELMLLPVHFPHLYLFWTLLVNIPAVPAHFPHPYIFRALLANILAMPTHFILQASSVHLLLLYLFNSHRLLLNPLDFLILITTSLPLITFQGYWLLSQPNEFINSFLKLPWPIYFLFTSYCSHGFTTSFLKLSWPICFFFTSYHSVGLLTIIPAILACWACFTIFSSHFLHIVRLLLLLCLLSKVDINTFL